MNSTQNRKIEQVKTTTVVIGIDVGSEFHYARAFDHRGFEYSKKPLRFSNTESGFCELLTWMQAIKDQQGKENIIAGMEPTGHYWFCLGVFLKDNGIRPVLVNPQHVKKSKELDDNSQSKNDRKDPKVIAGLVKDGRYSEPYIPEGVYAELRTASNLRFRIESELTSVKNRLARWISIYFPEYRRVYNKPDAKDGLMILKEAPLPEDIIVLGAEGVNRIWRKAKLRGSNGRKRAESLVEAAKQSIGIRNGGKAARIEIRMLLEIKGVGKKTVSGFLAEVGDVRRFTNPKQLQKYAGLAIVENSSGKHKGRTRISRRGRKRLRYLLFEVSMSLVSKNPEFRELHRYYTTREVNPLRKMQSLIAVGCKLIRIFYALLTKGDEYSAEKMRMDIRRPQVQTPDDNPFD
ncbi:IS110 family transposase [Hornefia porci]|uniref:IS110 family transposase n=1 Tax=Hornefia porci TaxID=2652292 RepID=A0A1Q9JHC4_9FIRM|nr:IS110 family transposase [Hornefia porci]OLR55606.1 IS110 family transposase [Hornefia porci]